MPEKKTIERAKKKLRQGKSPSTAAGEFVREEIEHARQGKHEVRSPEQAIAIGLSKARKAGIPLPPQPHTGTSRRRRRRSRRPSRALTQALKREAKRTLSPDALARHAHESAVQRGPASRHKAAMKAVRTKGAAGRKAAARKAARTRARHRRG